MEKASLILTIENLLSMLTNYHVGQISSLERMYVHDLERLVQVLQDAKDHLNSFK